jgi:RimJ/RimL family protein N-acetyltransferase
VRDLSSIARVEGPSLTLRLIQTEDAAYVHSLRNNPAYNTHLSTVTGTFDDQRTWIKDYKSREAHGQEFYYVIERKDGTRCGLVRLYDIEAESFTWGSWILDENKPRKAALESAVLSFGIGFDVMERAVANVDVRLENKHATSFYERLGMTETHRIDGQIFFTYLRARFDADKEAYHSILEQEERNA